MATKTDGRTLDKHVEDELNANLKAARNTLAEKQAQFEEVVSAHPFEFVIGAFVGGLILGALLAKK